MNKKLVLITALVIMVFALTACAKAAATEAYPSMYENKSLDYAGAPAAAATEAPMMDEREAMVAPSPMDGASGSSAAPIQQMVIYNASLSIAVEDPGKTMNEIIKLAESLGGHVVNSNIYKSLTRDGVEVPEAYLMIRVPADQLNFALDQIKAMTGDTTKYTLSESISGQDVTQEYTDLSSRLKNLQEADAKLTELYDKAEKTEDALAVYNQKVQLTEQIEVIKGQMNYYEQSAAQSAINITIVDQKTITPPITVAGWQPKGVAEKALRALVEFGKGLVEFLIWLVITIIPIVVIIGAPIYFLVRWLVKRGRRKAAERMEALRKAMESQQPPVVKQ